MQIKELQLDNGIVVLLERIPHVRSVSIGIWVRAGSRHEPGEVAGISHLLEHALFKGTTKRSAREIAQAIDGVGGVLNAFTTKEYTCYYAKVLDQHVALAVEILADMFRNPRFAKDNIEREKRVIFEEIGMYEDSPEDQVHDLFATTIFGGHPLGRSVLGSRQTIAEFSQKTAADYKAAHYIPENVVISAAGSFDVEEVAVLLAEYFGGLSGKGEHNNGVPPKVCHASLVKYKDTEQAHICLGFEGVKLDDQDMYPLNVANTILGSGMSSRLFQRIREEAALAYSVFSYHTAFSDTGLFVVYAGTTPKNVGEVVTIALEEIADLKNNGPSEEELSRAKEQLKGHFTLGFEDTANRMSRLGKGKLLVGRVYGFDELLEKIDQVGEDDIRRVMDRFSKEDVVVTGIGPFKEEEFQAILDG